AQRRRVGRRGRDDGLRRRVPGDRGQALPRLGAAGSGREGSRRRAGDPGRDRRPRPPSRRRAAAVVSLARALVAEALGTFTLVFAGAGAVMVDAKTGELGHVGVAITFGLVIMAMIYAVGHISGAHFNGAVTFAFALSRHFPWRRAAGYWAAQLT